MNKSLSWGLFFLTSLPFVTGCHPIGRKLIFDKTIEIPAGRFSGPIEIDVPKRAEHRNRDFEIEVVLHAACSPQLRVSTPDGEVATLGDDDENWQKWLAKRALASSAADRPNEPPGAGPTNGPAVSGHWQAVRTESWPGQLMFLRLRQKHCSTVNTYEMEYLNAFDESGRVIPSIA